ncbi:hypothetical protein BDZ89DRAFT_1138676 [Hymenopellis radicata]|nr:hypothetical protein BDZ89DRAFT_1138676 [Hymenopellis radicata]
MSWGNLNPSFALSPSRPSSGRVEENAGDLDFVEQHNPVRLPYSSIASSHSRTIQTSTFLLHASGDKHMIESVRKTVPTAGVRGCAGKRGDWPCRGVCSPEKRLKRTSSASTESSPSPHPRR